MKIIPGILGCALVAGLMTFAADKSQAGVVIGNEVYSPVKLKITAQYVDGSKIKTMSISSKDVLKDLGYNSNVQLASASYAPFDIWVINKDTLMQDLSTNDVLYFDYSSVISTTKNTKYNESGVLEVSFTSDMDDNSFDIYGVYAYSSNTSKTSNSGTYNFSEKLKAKSLSGNGFFPSLNDTDDIPVTGTASYNGSGKLTAP